MSEKILKFQCGKCGADGGPDLKAIATALEALMVGQNYVKERNTVSQCLGAIGFILIQCYMNKSEGDTVHSLLRYEMEFLFNCLANPEDEMVKSLDMFSRITLNGVRRMLLKAREQ